MKSSRKMFEYFAKEVRSIDKIQQQHIRLQNLLFLYIPTLDSDIKARFSVIVKSHHEALSMKEKLELLIAMKEIADIKISKTHGPECGQLYFQISQKGMNLRS